MKLFEIKTEKMPHCYIRKLYRLCLTITFIILTSFVTWMYSPSNTDVIEKEDFNSFFDPGCVRGFFRLPGMEECQPWLSCQDVKSGDFKESILDYIGIGGIKRIKLSVWKGHEIAQTKLLFNKYEADMKQGLVSLTELQPSVYVTQLIGSCKDSFFTEYHRLGGLHRLETILNNPFNSQLNTIHTRMKVALSYIRVVRFMHNSPTGVRVMCDSNTLGKLLSQLLICEDLSVVYNDMDALERMDENNKTVCGVNELSGDLLAPEQLWPYKDRKYTRKEMPGYDEKVDIYKVPPVTNFILGNVVGSETVKEILKPLHEQCLNRDPRKRPSAIQIFKEYAEIYTKLKENIVVNKNII